jgi:hypothetical protein
METKNLFTGVCIAVGLIVMGICINKGLQSFSNKERVVTVKGLAQKQFQATSATIKIYVGFSGDLAKEITEKTEKTTAEIADYLKTVGYENAEISDIDVYDNKTYYEYDWENGKRIKIKRDRYSATQKLSFEVKEVTTAAKVRDKINFDMIAKDFSANIKDIEVDYHFADLNSIKPELIAESTKNARASGEQFAKDSKSRLGKIKTASQGQIDLSDDEYTQTARVVSTIIFFLED